MPVMPEKFLQKGMPEWALFRHRIIRKLNELHFIIKTNDALTGLLPSKRVTGSDS